MALSGNTVWEVRTAGSDTNGGGFVAGASGTDFSQQDSAQFAFTTITTAAANAICLSASADATMVGNICQIVSGTNFIVGFYQILSVVAGASFTLDRTCTTAAGSNGVINIGGSLSSPGQAGSAAVANNICYIKAGTYTIASATANISGGCVTWPASSGGSVGKIIGYNATRGDYGTRPLLQASGISTFTVIKVSTKTRVDNISVDGAALTGSQGIASGSNVDNYAYLCKVVNCKNGGIVTQMANQCEVSGCSTVAAIGSTYCFYCWSHDNTISGYSPSGIFTGLGNYIFCIASNNSGASSDGFSFSALNGEFINCVSFGSGRDGFRFNSGSNTETTVSSCLATNNAGFGFNNPGSPADGTYLFNCAGYLNASGNTNTFVTGNVFGFVTLSVSPFNTPASNDFSLNNTAGGGAACRAAGIPGIFPGAVTTGYLDIGAAQHHNPTTASVA